MKLALLFVTMTLALGVPRVAGADAERDARARALYGAGRDAYNAGDFQKAYDSFKESFQLSHQPALLYNIASALQGLKRPHDAAEALRSFLRLKPDDPDKPQIEERIKTLEEEQRILDMDKPRPAPTPTTPPPVPAVTASSPSLVSSTPADDAAVHARMKKRNVALAVGLSVGAVVVAGVAIGLAFGLNPKEQPLTPSPVGPITATQ